MARSFSSATSRCASTDFTPFPLSAFGAMAEVVGEIDCAVVLVAMGAKRSSLSASGRRGERRRFVKIGVTTGRMVELPLFPLLIKREGADVPPFRIKEPPTISPMTPHSTRAVREGAVDTE